MDYMDSKKVVEELLEDYLYEPEIARIVGILDEMGFFTAPASTKYHGAYTGGLFEHSYEVTKALLNLTNSLQLVWRRRISPVIIGLFHDLVKCQTYKLDPETGKYTYRKGAEPGHGEVSVRIADEILSLTDEERQCIRWHMGAYDDKSNWAPLGEAIEQYPNVLWTHTADMVASKLKGI